MRLLIAVLFFVSCTPAQTTESFPNPAPEGSVQPNWSVGPAGAVFSWIEPAKNGLFTLRYALRSKGSWTEPRTVAAARRFFRHPAELPEIMQLGETSWLAHWVEMPSDSSEAEYIFVSSSTDGIKWTAPAMAHRDKGAVQHGLVSMIASGRKEASLFWLHTPEGEDGPGNLVRSVVSSAGKLVREERLDTDVCQCCSTAVANTTKGLVVAYRDHTSGDVRDLSVTRLENGKWSSPKTVHADHWVINACPVNGPAIAAKGERAAVAWYTAAGDSPRTQVAFSNDSGSTFGQSVVVSTGRSQGYTSIVLDDAGSAFVSWIEQGGETSRLLVRAIDASGKASGVQQVAAGSRTALGYPKLVSSGKDVLITWGNASGRLQTATVRR